CHLAARNGLPPPRAASGRPPRLGPSTACPAQDLYLNAVREGHERPTAWMDQRGSAKVGEAKATLRASCVEYLCRGVRELCSRAVTARVLHPISPVQQHDWRDRGGLGRRLMAGALRRHGPRLGTGRESRLHSSSKMAFVRSIGLMLFAPLHPAHEGKIDTYLF